MITHGQIEATTNNLVEYLKSIFEGAKKIDAYYHGSSARVQYLNFYFFPVLEYELRNPIAKNVADYKSLLNAIYGFIEDKSQEKNDPSLQSSTAALARYYLLFLKKALLLTQAKVVPMVVDKQIQKLWQLESVEQLKWINIIHRDLLRNSALTIPFFSSISIKSSAATLFPSVPSVPSYEQEKKSFDELLDKLNFDTVKFEDVARLALDWIAKRNKPGYAYPDLLKDGLSQTLNYLLDQQILCDDQPILSTLLGQFFSQLIDLTAFNELALDKESIENHIEQHLNLPETDPKESQEKRRQNLEALQDYLNGVDLQLQARPF